jgi:hypothetical protein
MVEMLEALETRVPETQPQSVRYGPPRCPPAPPGTAGAGGEDEPRRTRGSLAAALDDLWPRLQRMQRLFDTFEASAEGGGDAGSLRWAIDATREDLAASLQTLRRRVHAEHRRFFETDLQQFKRRLLRLSVVGVARVVLDIELRAGGMFLRAARTEATGAVRMPGLLFTYPLPARVSFFRLGFLPPGEFVRVILNDLIEVCRNEGHYVSRHVFEREVVQRCLALVYVSRLATPGAGRECPPSPPPSTPRSDDPEERRLRNWDRGSGR